jgi:hypothetical protein
MARPRRILDSGLVVLCYLLWTGVLLGVVSVVGLWIVGRVRGEEASSSSQYQILEDNAPLLLGGAAVLAAVAGGLSIWVDRHVD